MNQKQKDTIREEFRREVNKPEFPFGLPECIWIDKISDFWLNKLDQAYQQGAKDKVEEVMNNVEDAIENYFISYTIPDAKVIMGYVRQSLKDNT